MKRGRVRLGLNRPAWPGYGATKAGVVALTRELAAQVGRTGTPATGAVVVRR